MSKSAKTNKVSFPTNEKWGEFYGAWRDDLVKSLGAGHAEGDCEDAVEYAFQKLIHKQRKEYGHVPETEAEWRNCVRWQAKAYLSHLYESRGVWSEYHRQAAFETQINAKGVAICNIDRDVRASAAFRTLRELCREAGMKDYYVEAYVRWYLNGEPSARVAADYHTNPNNLYAIRFKIEGLLAGKGRERFKRIQRELFLEAA